MRRDTKVKKKSDERKNEPGRARAAKCAAGAFCRLVQGPLLASARPSAFGAYAGGLNVLDEAFGPLFSRHRLEVWMMGRAEVYPVLGSLLLPD